VITVVHNSLVSPAGRLVPVLERADMVVNHVRAHLGERLPWKPEAVVILGGEMSVFQEGRYPYIRDEKGWIRTLAEQDTPILGIGLGAQLLADALGGRAYPADRPEAGVIDLTLTEEGAADPVIGALRSPVFTVHADTFELPPGAALLASSDRFPHAFRLGPTLGIQFHPEIPSSKAADWARNDLRPVIQAAGTDPDALVHQVVAAEHHLESEAERLFERWLSTCPPRSGGRGPREERAG
jgi:GMP synthase (glutamine-hydrolysing)